MTSPPTLPSCFAQSSLSSTTLIRNDQRSRHQAEAGFGHHEREIGHSTPDHEQDTEQPHRGHLGGEISHGMDNVYWKGERGPVPAHPLPHIQNRQVARTGPIRHPSEGKYPSPVANAPPKGAAMAGGRFKSETELGNKTFRAGWILHTIVGK